MMANHSEITNFIWGIAELIRDAFKRGKYQGVILPFTVLRLIDAVLETSKQAVLERHQMIIGKLDNLYGESTACSLFPITLKENIYSSQQAYCLFLLTSLTSLATALKMG